MGGANNWGSMSVDEERGIVYVPTGSANYDFYGADRLGQNLFANCLLALDAKTGKRLWHFQTVHHDLWDFDNVAAPQLVTVRHNGRRVDAVALAGKTNFLYVFDRVTGKPLWPIEERPVPKSDMPGEKAWPTQPWPTKPAPFGRMTFTVDDVNPWLATPEQYEAMKQRVAKARNEGPFTPPGLTDTISMPGNQGGANWMTTAANPEKGLVFVVGVNQVAILQAGGRRRRAPARDRPRRWRRAGGAPLAGRLPRVSAALHRLSRRQPARGAARRDRSGRHHRPHRRGRDQGGRSPAARATCGPCRASPTPEMTAVISYLALSSAVGGRGRGGRGVRRAAGRLPPGPVVASGGAPQPPPPPRFMGPFYPGIGGNAGNLPYPDGCEGRAAGTRYMTDYGVLASFTKPPYTTLTAYDLNTGEIKWQVPNGDHPPTMAAGGPSNTGGVGARYGIVVTKGGLVFHAGGDGKVRAYDEDTGQVLWTGTFSGSTSGVPVSYEAKGRQYFVDDLERRGRPWRRTRRSRAARSMPTRRSARSRSRCRSKDGVNDDRIGSRAGASMNRREFFSTAAGVAALASHPVRVGGAGRGSEGDWKKVRQSTLDRIAIMTLNFQSILKVPDTQHNPNRTLELFDIGEMLADTYGVHKVEFQHYHLASIEPSYFKDLRSQLEKSKSRATQINLEFSGLNISAPQQRDRLLAIDLTKMWIDHAVTLGAQRVMINQGQPTQENKVHSIPTLKAMADYGKSKNIIVSVETRGGGGGGRGRGGQGGQGRGRSGPGCGAAG